MNTILNGDCLEIMPTLDENSMDAIITDPPYGLSFMGNEWDHGVPGVEFWKAALRVAKPGAFILSFGGTRTHHRLTCAIEDAGFEIRDCMMWLYGSGFPKSHNLHGEYEGFGTALKPAWEPIIVARKPLEGTVAENVLKWGCGGMNIGGSRIEGKKRSPKFKEPTSKGQFGSSDNCNLIGWDYSQGRWPANVILDEEAGAMLDGQSGKLTSGASKSTYIQKESENLCVSGKNYVRSMPDRSKDSGGASRFFYCAKASKKERGEGNNHPTVKPISLLNYLAKLACPPCGLILDPFMGSGSTAIAAMKNGMRFIGIEKEPAYCEIAKARSGLLVAA
jgi:site-specific DNA-methyltransferase (adenine-specific)